MAKMEQARFGRPANRRISVSTICAFAVIATLAFAPATWGQTSTEGYAGQGGNTLAEVSQGTGPGGGPGGSPPAGPSAEGSGTLAFTGLDLGLIAGGGLLLLALGAGMARMLPRAERP
jgi:hypothetical protein